LSVKKLLKGVLPKSKFFHLRLNARRDDTVNQIL